MEELLASATLSLKGLAQGRGEQGGDPSPWAAGTWRTGSGVQSEWGAWPKDPSSGPMAGGSHLGREGRWENYIQAGGVSAGISLSLLQQVKRGLAAHQFSSQGCRRGRG